MWEQELEACIRACKKAREGILQVYNTPFEVEIKSDDSPVTIADKNADKLIRETLHKEFPNYALLTEESEDDLSRRKNDYLFIVDPVDGTKDFVASDDEFTTNIALAYKGEVVVGVVGIPVTGEIYFATKNGGSFYLEEGKKPVQIHVNDKKKDLTILTSRYHVTKEEEDIIKNHADLITKVEKYGSSIKACRIAHGKAEISYRLGNGTKEWDTAASQIIVLEAGGVFAQPDLSPITYNKEDVYNRKGFIILNSLDNVIND